MKDRSWNIRKLIIAVMILALGIGTINVGKVEASSSLPKPKISLSKREKKGATIQLKAGDVTGYRVYMKTSKKGKWQLQAIMMRGMKGEIKGKQATFSLKSNTLKLSKLKPKKVYYVKVKTWKSSWRRYGRIKRSSYSKVLKIKKYQKKKTKKKPKKKNPKKDDSKEDDSEEADAATGDAVLLPDQDL